MRKSRVLRSAWRPFVKQALRRPAHEPVVVPFDAVPHPRDVGFRRSLGRWHGQRADYRAPLKDGRGLHVHVFGDRYEIHWDHVHFHANPLKHWLRDSPITFGIGVLAFAAVGVAFAR